MSKYIAISGDQIVAPYMDTVVMGGCSNDRKVC